MEAKLLSWYELNKDSINDRLSTPYFKDWFYATLDEIAELPDKQTILEVMRKISAADDDVHVSERALITLAERYWKLN